jgi:hypothetical protein
LNIDLERNERQKRISKCREIKERRTMNIHTEQLSLSLFQTSTFEQLIKQEGVRTLLIFISARLKRGWHVKVDRRSGIRTLTVPSYLEDAPVEIKKALIQWALLPLVKSKDRTRSLKIEKLQLEHQIQTYIRNLDTPKLRVSQLNTAELELKTRGARYDLRELFNTINESYFQNSISSSVRWGGYSSLTSYQTTKTGKDGTRFNLITIAGVYDHPDVPLFAVEAVMYHEMLHIAIPPYLKNGKHVIHGPEFKRAEKEYGHFLQWREWERTALRNLARNLKRKKRT